MAATWITRRFAKAPASSCRCVTGAYLFLGDGHALEGDGEAVGSGIETSLDVQFTVALRKKANLTEPRVENAEYLISIGARTACSHSLNDALTIANSDMIRWLIEEYGIEPIAAHLLIGHQAKYDVAALSGVMAVKIPKRALLKCPLMYPAEVPSRIAPNRMPPEYGSCARLPAGRPSARLRIRDSTEPLQVQAPAIPVVRRRVRRVMREFFSGIAASTIQ